MIKKVLSQQLIRFGFVLITGWACSTQASTHPVSLKATKQATDLKDFEGFYLFPNHVAFVQIQQKNGELIARQVWDNREYTLLRKADLTFESKQEEYQLEFTKDQSGKITTAKILNRVILTKVDYDPTKPVMLTAGQLSRMEGKYQLQNDKSYYLQVTAKDNSLELKQTWDDKLLVFKPRSEVDFINEEHKFPLRCIIEDGKVKRVVCFGKDVWDKVE